MKRTVLVLLLLAACGAAYFLVSIGIEQVKKSVEEQYDDSGRSLARVYSMIFENMMQQSQDALRVYTEGVRHELLSHPILNEKGVAPSDKTAPPSQATDKLIVDYIRKERSRRPSVFSYMFFANANGQMWNDNGAETDVSDRPYFKDIVEDEKQESIGTAAISRTSGQSVVHLARAIRGNMGTLYGVIGAVIPVDRIEQLFNETMPSATLQPFVSDESMMCILHPESQPDVRSVQEDGDIRIYSSIDSFGKHSEKFYIRKITNADWYVGVSVADKQLYGTYNRLNRAKGIVFASVTAALLLLYAASLLSLARFSILRREAVENDPLTELLSEATFEHQAQKILDSEEIGEFALVEMDLNGFKFINKSYGVEAGNDVLRQFSKIIKEQLKEYGGIIGRGYADHFYYFVKVPVDKDIFMERLLFVICDISQTVQKEQHPFTPKYGVSFVTKLDGELKSKKSILQLIGEASTARKIAKQQPDRDFCVYSTEIEQRILKEQQIERNMKQALANGEFFVVYQPKISLETEKIIGAEALVRWDSPEMGLLPPNDFIPVFERNGFICQLDFAVYEMAFRFIRTMLDEGHDIVPISLNMSRMHNDADAFVREFVRLIKKYNIPPNLVEVEILERAVSNEKPVLKEVTETLKSLGFSVAMDDFGSGESSLNMLNTIPIDTLKFDQNFLRGKKDSESLRTFITSLVQMAQKLQRKTVFEGVETKEQRDFLKSINCDIVQGYFYSRPLKERDFVSFMEQHL